MHDEPTAAIEIDVTTELAHLRAACEAMVLEHEREVEHLHEGMRSRKVIGQALGLVMSEFQLTEGAAFEVLRRRSSHTNVKLRDLALEMVEAANKAGRVLWPVADC